MRIKSPMDLPPHLRAQVQNYLQPAQPKRQKYGNKPVTADGIRFPSLLERDRYEQLKLLWLAGEVRWFVRQVSFDLPGGVRYVSDFVVIWANNPVTVEDAKGVLKQETRNKLKQVREKYGITVDLVERAAHGALWIRPWDQSR